MSEKHKGGGLVYDQTFYGGAAFKEVTVKDP